MQSSLQTAVLSQGVYFVRERWKLVHHQHTLLEVISVTVKKKVASQLALPGLLLQNLPCFQDLPKGKEGINFCLSGLKSKMQRKKKKNEVKEARGAAGLMHVSLLCFQSSIWLSMSGGGCLFH